MLVVVEQQHARESEETARLWKEEAVLAQEVIARLTQDLASLSPASLHKLIKRAPAAPYVARQQEEITPLMLSERAPPNLVHTGYHVVDPCTKLYLTQKDYDLTVNVLTSARAVREGDAEEMFYECAEEAGPGNGVGMLTWLIYILLSSLCRVFYVKIVLNQLPLACFCVEVVPSHLRRKSATCQWTGVPETRRVTHYSNALRFGCQASNHMHQSLASL